MYSSRIVSNKAFILTVISFYDAYLTRASPLSPTPQVEWVKMGQHLPTKAKTESHGKLLIVPDVEQEDGGKYMCKAKNTVGEVVHYFTVTVEGIFLPEPQPEENGNQL